MMIQSVSGKKMKNGDASIYSLVMSLLCGPFYGKAIICIVLEMILVLECGGRMEKDGGQALLCKIVMKIQFIILIYEVKMCY